jgi:hypothetical protein
MSITEFEENTEEAETGQRKLYSEEFHYFYQSQIFVSFFFVALQFLKKLRRFLYEVSVMLFDIWPESLGDRPKRRKACACKGQRDTERRGQTYTP